MSPPDNTFHLSATALEILRERYLRRNDRGEIIETPHGMLDRKSVV